MAQLPVEQTNPVDPQEMQAHRNDEEPGDGGDDRQGLPERLAECGGGRTEGYEDQ